MAEPRSKSPLTALLEFFSSIWTGVALLAVLFVYCSVGSAVPQLRQLPAFEMTEFEWFHWWPFKVNIALICLTVSLATIRRIPFRTVNYGVWMIHGGILVLAAGSVIYFTTKVEGDAPVARRAIAAAVPGHEPVTMTAVPGNSVQLGSGPDAYTLQVSSIDPQWEILSGADEGKRAYSVNVMVRTPSQVFIRQLLAGYPEYTEDLIQSPEPGGPPWTRAKKALGTAIVDETLDLALEYQPQEWFYLSNDMTKSWALYLREVPPDGSPPGEWHERPIEGLPLYNDYVADLDDVWPSAAVRAPRPLDVAVPALAAGDPLPGTTFTVRSYLRYAFPEERRQPGGDVFDPAVRVRLHRADGRSQDYTLLALDPVKKKEPQGRLVFEWADTEAVLEGMLEVEPPVLRIRVPEADVNFEIPIEQTASRNPDLPMRPIEGTGYSYRVQALHDGLQLPGGDVISVAAVEIETPQRTFIRWVTDDPSRTRDLPADADMAMAHGQLELDTGIVMEYTPGVGPAPLTIVGGPGDDQLRLVMNFQGQAPIVRDLAVREPVQLSETIWLSVMQYATHSTLEERPLVVPPEQRNRDVRARLAMIQLDVPGDGPLWLQFHHWPFVDARHAFARSRFAPTEIDVDGRRVELMFSRQRQRLPSPVVLDDFVMDTHIGGFSGQNISVRNWTSEVRFRDGGGWTTPMSVSVNDPQEFGGLWYFQAQWDPPEPAEGYAGLNYTVLGIGNRNGVNVMLLGCCLTVLGMIYAFYVKPVIKRRRQRALYAELVAERRGQAPPAEPPRVAEPVGAPAGSGQERS